MKYILILVITFFMNTSNGATILIDPGHGGEEKGAVSKIDGTQEKILALELAFRIRNYLLPNHNVYLTRVGDQTLTLEKRSLSAQKIGADIFISIHANSSESSHSNGFETFYLNNNVDAAVKKVVRIENGEHSHPMHNELTGDTLTGQILAEIVVGENIPKSKRLGTLIHQSVAKGIAEKYEIKDRGIKPGLFYVLAMTKIPGVLLEAGFLSNRKDLDLMKNKSYMNDYAASVANGINRYFDETKKDNRLLSEQ